MAEFFAACFHTTTYEEVRFLRANLDWRNDRTDRFIAALCLGALHGESHRSPNYFSNRMPRTISTKPAYSVRWWNKHGYVAPRRDVFAILRNMVDFRFRTPPPESRGEVLVSDARKANLAFPHLGGKVTDIITSPPTSTPPTTAKTSGSGFGSWAIPPKALTPATTDVTTTEHFTGSSLRKRGKASSLS